MLAASISTPCGGSLRYEPRRSNRQARHLRVPQGADRAHLWRFTTATGTSSDHVKYALQECNQRWATDNKELLRRSLLTTTSPAKTSSVWDNDPDILTAETNVVAATVPAPEPWLNSSFTPARFRSAARLSCVRQGTYRVAGPIGPVAELFHSTKQTHLRGRDQIRDVLLRGRRSRRPAAKSPRSAVHRSDRAAEERIFVCVLLSSRFSTWKPWADEQSAPTFVHRRSRAVPAAGRPQHFHYGVDLVYDFVMDDEHLEKRKFVGHHAPHSTRFSRDIVGTSGLTRRRKVIQIQEARHASAPSAARLR